MSTDKTNKHIKPYTDIEVGDIVIVSRTNWNHGFKCVEVYSKPCIAIALWRGCFDDTQVVLTRVGEYKPFWSDCKNIIEVVGHTNLKEMIEKLEVKNEV